MKKLFLCGLIMMLTTSALAGDLSGLYDQSTLRYWQNRYSQNIRWNFENVVLKVLNRSEYQALSNVSLRFPRVGEIKGGALEFYSLTQKSTPEVVLPVLSIKFFDDLAIAISWLDEKGYQAATVTDYVSMLKYLQPSAFPGGRYLKPLEALQIPPNALRYGRVDSLSQKILKSALIWILAHELAHIYYKHPGYGPKVSAENTQQNEIQADRFATDIMHRIGVPPIGIAYFFTMALHLWPNRSDFNSNAAWRYYIKSTTHPLTTDRLRILANDMEAKTASFVRKERNYAAALNALRQSIITIRNLANFLADEERQKTIKRKAIVFSQIPDPLKPRPLN
jgi:arsenate reductase-like glutaredoxin family protein